MKYSEMHPPRRGRVAHVFSLSRGLRDASKLTTSSFTLLIYPHSHRSLIPVVRNISSGFPLLTVSSSLALSCLQQMAKHIEERLAAIDGI
jgi:hypothetical protein